MSKKEKDVELIPDPTAAFGWKVKHDLKSGTNPDPSKPDAYPKIKFDPNSGPHLIVYSLPKQPANLTFDANNPIAIAKGETSSPAVGSGIDPMFPDWAIFDGGKTLVVLDKNNDASQTFYRYTIKASNYDKVLDPIVDNGGGVGTYVPPGGGGGFAPPGGGGYDASYLIGAAVLGAFLAVAFVRFILRWRAM
jgi:hypothetical protein